MDTSEKQLSVDTKNTTANQEKIIDEKLSELLLISQLMRNTGQRLNEKLVNSTENANKLSMQVDKQAGSLEALSERAEEVKDSLYTCTLF